MQRFIYTPKIEAYVSLDDNQRGHKTIDLTNDIISGTVDRRLNAMSEATLTLQNKYGKYTGGYQDVNKTNNVGIVIRPMDRIIIRLARVGAPFLVFSGYVDEAPYYQLYPGSITIRCSDPLKLLQYTYFDPGLPYMTTFFAKFGWTYDPSTGMLSDGAFTNGAVGRFGNFDVSGGIKDVLTDVLTDIAAWPANAIDILSIPPDFLKNVSKAMTQELSDQQREDEQFLERLVKLFGGQAGIPTGDDPGTAVMGNIAPAKVARYVLNAGFKGDNAITAVAIARAESTFNSSAMNYNTNGSYDVGLFQINTVHTSGGTGLPSPGHTGTITMAEYNAIKASLPSGVQAFIQSMFDPVANAAEAYALSGGTNFTPWATYNNNLHKPYLDMARQAIGAASLQGGAFNTPGSIPTAATTTPAAPTALQRQSASTATVATKIVQIAIAESQKGIVEQGGQNQGPEIKKYQDYVGLAQGPSSPWCAAFVSWVFGQAGNSTVRTAAVIQLDGYGVTVPQPAPGDIVAWDSQHTGIVTTTSGSSFSGVAGNEGNGVRTFGPYTVGQTSEVGVVPHFIRVAGIGTAASDAATNPSSTTASSATSDIQGVALQAAWFTLQLQGSNPAESQILTGQRALANDVPLMQWIGSMCEGSARVYTTKPDGTFFAFFPDRFGYFKTTPYFRVSDIELMDLTVQRNDQNVTTHVFATGAYFAGNPATSASQWLAELGSTVASVESSAFPYFINVDVDDPRLPAQKGKFDVFNFLKKYGARPFQYPLPEVRHPVLLWMGAWMKFIELWAKQYTATASMTFMPELLPGGLVEFGGRITMFVESVQHSFDLTSGFTTTAELSSPSAVNTDRFKGLPIAGTRFTDGDYLTKDPSQFSKDLGNIGAT